MALKEVTINALLDESGGTIAYFDQDGLLWINEDSPWDVEDAIALMHFIAANTAHTVTPRGGEEK